MRKYNAIIYDIDGTILNTLNMNMYPLMKIIEEETNEKWTFDQVLKFASYPGMKSVYLVIRFYCIKKRTLKRFLNFFESNGQL